ncbi:type II toxin-antitoxin system RelE/ParE family toxin [Kamptonema sp. UHCC 0994]|uniref:type II toxin-antitoxin system RelE/ParE family toxin n=1 Tax=Kamptonema sp. UHCC 0994 TaxID=3031329 RepID=UPI0023BA71F4|nr:type II toxin-antitoxin system RelE/ParE family toxin [Kamptonema sp. UHCC 0994]MDF0556694.1 type II toxin-antitoxin system RelE/ParE family toxin [Kamptonema sp. UHCC 0994]
MQNDPPLIEIKPTREFQGNLRALSKKYRHIRSDVQAIIELLQAGELLGDKIPGTGYEVFKVRVKNSDIKKGKSAGYRLIYYVKTLTSIILIAIYSKSEQSDIAAEQIQQIVTDFNNLLLTKDERQDTEINDLD